MTALCSPCAAASAAWLDYRLPPTLGITYGSGAPYDVTAAGLRDRSRARFEQWRTLIREQRASIAAACRAGAHAAASEPEAPRVVQLDLLGDPAVAA